MSPALRQRPALLPILLLSALLLAGGIGTELGVSAARKAADESIARQMQGELAQLRSRIESVLNSTLYLASGIEAQIRAERGRVDKDSITRSLAVLQSRSEVIRNIALAPDNRITYIYPLQGNERALGLYYPDNPAQWPAIERVMLSRQPFLAGPVKLAQGGEGLIYRLPVFLDDSDRYWGMISTVLDLDKLWAVVGLGPEQKVQIQILGKDASGAQGEPVLGGTNKAPPGTPVFGIDISVPGGQWRLLSPARGAGLAQAPVALIRLTGWGMTVILLLATLALLRSDWRLRRLNLTLEDARAAAEAGARAKSSFLAMMSHEIRTPMNGILGMTQLLLQAELPKQQADFARTAHQSAESLLVILDDILDYSKIEAGHLSIEEIEFNLLELLENIAELFAIRAAAKGLDFIVVLDPQLPAGVYGDPTRLRQILNNLISNAIKFTETGSVQFRVQRLAAPSSQIEFSVQDSGIGIDADAQARLFSPFVQADSSHTRRFGGTGLGLSISQRLAQIMGSQIKLDSQAGHGSRFSLQLHLRPAARREDARLHAVPLALNVPPRLLFVSASPAFSQAILPWLQALGTQAEHLSSAEAAKQALRDAASATTALALLVLDDSLPERQSVFQTLLQLPELNACKLLRLEAPTQNASALPYAGERSYILSKPVRPSALAHSLHEMLSPRGAPTASTQALRPALQRGRILLVEDNPINRKVALAMLQPMGPQVECAENGAEAVERLSHEQFDLVLMDMQMPVMDGPQASACIRDPSSSVLQHDIPIIALTANAFAEHREACLAAGMNDFLAKPIASDALRAMLARHLPAMTQATPREA